MSNAQEAVLLQKLAVREPQPNALLENINQSIKNLKHAVCRLR